MNSNDEIDDSPAPLATNKPNELNKPNEQNKQNGQNNTIKWGYFEKDNKYLLRFFCKENKYLRFETLNTINISDKYEMFSEYFNREDLIKDIEIKEDYDPYTYLNELFEDIHPIQIYNKNNEIELIITKKSKKQKKHILKSTVCDDKEFFKKNIEKRLEQIKKYNESLKKRNEDLENDLKIIKEMNEKLSTLNEKCSKSLKDLESLQVKAITQLNDQ